MIFNVFYLTPYLYNLLPPYQSSKPGIKLYSALEIPLLDASNQKYKQYTKVCIPGRRVLVYILIYILE